MYYAILAYHAQGVVQAMSPAEQEALMTKLLALQAPMVEAGSLGPQVRLDATDQARTVRAGGMVLDGPFAETKEQLLGFYVVNCETQDEATAIARDLQKVNPTAVYEVRPVLLYVPGAPFGLPQ